MRPGQNAKRARRGRKPHNFQNRTFDSNGPDVKIRGTASHIYEKYQALARDAHASGDRIGAESYLQHAEHYYRVLSSFQPAQPNGRMNGVPNEGQNGAQHARPEGDDGEGDDAQNAEGGDGGEGDDDNDADEAQG